DAEDPRRLGLIARTLLERREDPLAIVVGRSGRGRRPRHRRARRRWRSARFAEDEVLGAYAIGIAEEDGTLEHVAQLAQVAGPAIALEQEPRVVGERERRTTRARTRFGEQRRRDPRDLGSAIAQRRNLDRDPVQAKEEILPELPEHHEEVEIAMGG